MSNGGCNLGAHHRFDRVAKKKSVKKELFNCAMVKVVAILGMVIPVLIGILIMGI